MKSYELRPHIWSINSACTFSLTFHLMGRQNKYSAGDLEMVKQDKKHSKVSQVSILHCFLVFANSPPYSTHAGFGNNFHPAEHLSAKSVQIRLLIPFYFILETSLQFASVFYISAERCCWRLKHFSLDILPHHCEGWLVLSGRHWQNSQWSSSVWSQFMSCSVILDSFLVCSTYEELSVSFWKIPQALFQQPGVPRNTKADRHCSAVSVAPH